MKPSGFLCADWGVPVSVFYPPGKPTQRQIDAAKTICRQCKRIDDCLNLAILNVETHGIWGGMTEDERRLYQTREALKAYKARSLQQNTLHDTQHLDNESPVSSQHTSYVRIRIPLVLSPVVEAPQPYLITLPKFL